MIWDAPFLEIRIVHLKNLCSHFLNLKLIWHLFILLFLSIWLTIWEGNFFLHYSFIYLSKYIWKLFCKEKENLVSLIKIPSNPWKVKSFSIYYYIIQQNLVIVSLDILNNSCFYITIYFIILLRFLSFVIIQLMYVIDII